MLKCKSLLVSSAMCVVSGHAQFVISVDIKLQRRYDTPLYVNYS